MNHVSIIGCGAIGAQVAGAWQARGARVDAIARHPPALEGVRALAADLDRPQELHGRIPAGALVYYFAPPPPEGSGDARLSGFLANLDSGAPPARLVYISTSGVYGDCAGAWVDEDRPPAPGSARARRRLGAERALQGWSAATGVAIVILRVAGIYGPGRLPLERVRRGSPVLRPDLAPYSNRIHSADLARICVAAGERGPGGAIYNVSDGHPGSMSELHFAVADALGVPRPPTVDWTAARRLFSPVLLSFLAESRRLDNRRLRAELGVPLRYPHLAQGLAACPELQVRGP